MRTSEKVTDEELFNYIYYWKFENNLSWKFCTGILELNYKIDISIKELKKRIQNYLENKDSKESLSK